MPTYTIPSLSLDKKVDGTALAPYDVVTPVLMVKDANNKTAFVRGAPVTIPDEAPPAWDSGPTYVAGESSVTASWSLSDVGDSIISAHTPVWVGAYTESAPPSAAEVASEADLYGRVGGAQVADGKTTVSTTVTGLGHRLTYSMHAVARDAAGNLTAVQSGAATTLDATAPSLTGFAVSSSNETNFALAWSVSDEGDANAGDATPMTLGLYSAASAPSFAEVVAGSGAGFMRKTEVADAKSVSSTNFGDTGPSALALAPSTAYHVYAAVRDASGNEASVQTVSVTTPDVSTPANLSGVVVVPGATTLAFGGLDGITDNVEVTALEVRYSTGSDADGASVQVVDLSAGLPGSQVVAGLAEATAYNCWVRASDAAGNVATSRVYASGGGGVVTLDGTAPTVPATVTVVPGTTTLEFAGLQGISDNVAVSSVELLYHTADDAALATVVDASAAVSGGASSVTVEGVASGTAFFCWVRAADAAGNASTAAVFAAGGAAVATEAAAVASGASDATGVYGEYAESTAASPKLTALPQSLHVFFATDETGLYMVRAGNGRTGPVLLYKWDDAAGQMDLLGNTGVSPSTSHNYYTMDMTLANGVPFVIEKVSGSEAAVSRYDSGSGGFTRVGPVLSVDTDKIKCEYNRGDGLLYTAVTNNSGELTVRSIAVGADENTAWTEVASFTGSSAAFGMAFDGADSILLARPLSSSVEIVSIATNGDTTVLASVADSPSSTPQIEVDRTNRARVALSTGYRVSQTYLTEDLYATGGAVFTNLGLSSGMSHGEHICMDLSGRVLTAFDSGIYVTVGAPATTTQIGAVVSNQNRHSIAVDQQTGTVVVHYTETELAYVRATSVTAVTSAVTTAGASVLQAPANSATFAPWASFIDPVVAARAMQYAPNFGVTVYWRLVYDSTNTGRERHVSLMSYNGGGQTAVWGDYNHFSLGNHWSSRNRDPVDYTHPFPAGNWPVFVDGQEYTFAVSQDKDGVMNFYINSDTPVSTTVAGAGWFQKMTAADFENSGSDFSYISTANQTFTGVGVLSGVLTPSQIAAVLTTADDMVFTGAVSDAVSLAELDPSFHEILAGINGYSGAWRMQFTWVNGAETNGPVQKRILNLRPQEDPQYLMLGMGDNSTMSIIVYTSGNSYTSIPLRMAIPVGSPTDVVVTVSVTGELSVLIDGVEKVTSTTIMKPLSSFTNYADPLRFWLGANNAGTQAPVNSQVTGTVKNFVITVPT